MKILIISVVLVAALVAFMSMKPKKPATPNSNPGPLSGPANVSQAMPFSAPLYPLQSTE